MVLGPGNSSCGAWTQDHANPSGLSYGEDFWVQGFLSAVNEYGTGVSNITNGTDAFGVSAWISNYCAANPLKSISEAADMLVVELLKRNKPR